jgi:hypothetical protein
MGATVDFIEFYCRASAVGMTNFMLLSDAAFVKAAEPTPKPC